MALLYALELDSNRGGFRTVLTNEALYYAKGSPALAKLINDMHASARRKPLFGPKPPDAFFSIEQTTSMWAKYYEGNPVNELFPMLSNLQ